LTSIHGQENSFEETLRGYRQAVVWICRRHPSAIGDYVRLINYFWKYINKLTVECEHCHQRTGVWINDFSSLGRSETITRAYREAVIRKEIIEPPEVKASKKKLELKHRAVWKIS
jgi:hypothetical protein